MICPKCKTSNPKDAHFCFNCGTVLKPFNDSKLEVVDEQKKSSEHFTALRQNIKDEPAPPEAHMLKPALSESTLLSKNVGNLNSATFKEKETPAMNTVLSELDQLSTKTSTTKKKPRSEDEGDLDADDSQGVVRGLIEVVGVVAIILFIVMAGTVLYAVNRVTDAPVAAVKHELDLIREGEIQFAYADTAYDFRKNTRYDVFQQFITQNPTISNNKTIEIAHRTVGKDRAFVDGTLVSTSGDKVGVKYILIKEGNAWKILNIDLKS